MIEDSAEFFARHPDPETRHRGFFLIVALREWRSLYSAFVPLDPDLASPGPQTLAQAEKQTIERALIAGRQHRKETARFLGISADTLRRLIKKHDIKTKSKRMAPSDARLLGQTSGKST